MMSKAKQVLEKVRPLCETYNETLEDWLGDIDIDFEIRRNGNLYRVILPNIGNGFTLYLEREGKGYKAVLKPGISQKLPDKLPSGKGFSFKNYAELAQGLLKLLPMM